MLDRVLAGESLVVTRDGTPVAELRPLAGRTLDAVSLLARWRSLPQVDPARFRTDIDEFLDQEW